MSNTIFNGPEATNPFVFDYEWKRSYTFKTDVSESFGGNEQRRIRWERPLCKYTIPMNNKTVTNLTRLQRFFHTCRGRYDSFLFYDTMSNERWTIESGYIITSGTAVKKVYLPFKYLYPLTSPVGGTDYKIYVSATEYGYYGNCTVNTTDGSISFSGNYATSTQVIEVEYSHYIRVRFDTDNLEVTEKLHNLGDVSFDLVEVR